MSSSGCTVPLFSAGYAHPCLAPCVQHRGEIRAPQLKQKPENRMARSRCLPGATAVSQAPRLRRTRSTSPASAGWHRPTFYALCKRGAAPNMAVRKFRKSTGAHELSACVRAPMTAREKRCQAKFLRGLSWAKSPTLTNRGRATRQYSFLSYRLHRLGTGRNLNHIPTPKNEETGRAAARCILQSEVINQHRGLLRVGLKLPLLCVGEAIIH